MTAVFMDTFCLLAWLNPRDAAHLWVKPYMDRYTGPILTTEWVLVEFADALSAPAVRMTAVNVIRRVRHLPQFEVVGYDPVISDAGFDLFSRRPDKAWSLTDCVSFEVMARRRLADALTADHHFEQAGFRAIFRGG